MVRGMEIREYAPADWPQVWPIIEEVVRGGDTFMYDPAMTQEQARGTWIESPPGLTIVAADGGTVTGTAKMGPNYPPPGAHVSSASFMVAASGRGQGIGRALVEYAVDWAKRHDYAGMQFNAVAASNEHAVRLYQRLGFEVVGTVPRAFDHPRLGRVGLHIMYLGF
jgi:GNAT superfamily N-acetyltransferase